MLLEMLRLLPDSPLTEEYRMKIELLKAKTSHTVTGGGQFEWVDSLLVEVGTVQLLPNLL